MTLFSGAGYGADMRWLSAHWCIPPHRVTHPEKCQGLVESFHTSGWDCARGPLVGYWSREDHGYVQLLSGSHRYAAAKFAGVLMPVVVYSYRSVLAAWGDVPKWKKLMAGTEPT